MQGVRVRPLTIDGGETPQRRIERLIRENPVVIFSRRGCCMCHVMKRLLATLGVHPTVIELEDAEAAAIIPTAGSPTVYIGGDPVGGVEGLMALHLAGRLVRRLREFPLPYKQSPKNLFFNWYRIIGWMLNGLHSSLIIFSLNIHIVYHQAFRSDGQTADMAVVSTTVFSCIIWVVNMQIAEIKSYFT